MLVEPRKPGTCFVGRPGQRTVRDEAASICDSCGEEIVVPIDLSAGSAQQYVEDCPVCCRANVIHVEVNEEGEVRAWAEGEQNRTASR